jgi:ATP-binding protein involved in chromosome partitioning
MSPNDQDSKQAQVIAIPVAGGLLSAHFGHCESFALFDVDTTDGQILNSRQLAPPGHQPGVLPRWLREQGTSLVIAGGMGQRAQAIFAQHGIDVVIGAPSDPPETLVRSYLDGALQSGENLCDH